MCKKLPRILIVDDDINMLKALKLILEDQAGCLEILTAESVDLADDIIQRTEDLAGIIMDINLAHGISGEDFAIYLRSRGESLGITLMSGQVKHDGKFNFIAKPFDNIDILKVAKKMISHWSIRQDTTIMRNDMTLLMQTFEKAGYNVSTR